MIPGSACPMYPQCKSAPPCPSLLETPVSRCYALPLVVALKHNHKGNRNTSRCDKGARSLSRRPPSLFKGPRTRAANGRRTRRVTRRGTRWGLDVARTNRHDGTEQAGTCLQRTTIGRRLRKVDYDRLPKYRPPCPARRGRS